MEFVFVVPRTELFPTHTPHGLCLFGDGLVEADLIARVERHGFFVERERAEVNPNWKQIIPYSIVVYEGRVMLLRRTSRGGEARLHDKLSIGVGGHVNPVDMPASSDASKHTRNPIPAATRREVAEEELSIDGPYETHTVGILNDDTNPVGAVHVGVVQVIHAQGPVHVREVDQLEGRFVELDELRQLHADGADLETWSALLLPHLDTLVPNLVAS